MIFGIGNDIASVERLNHLYKRYGDHFINNILTKSEIILFHERKDNPEFLAGRWAAKEAFSKALGTGMCEKCAFCEIEILPDAMKKPYVVLLADTKKTADSYQIKRIHVSISHEREYAFATVLLETND